MRWSIATDPDLDQIIGLLTKEQQDCILALTEEWAASGYPKVQADILWGLGGTSLRPNLPELVDCTYHRERDRPPHYRHRLLPLGVLVKNKLLETVE